MTQQNNEFEKWWNDNPNRKSISNNDKQFARFIWQAAKADSEREIAELKSHINVLREALENLHDDIAEYQKLNNIGGYENQCMKQARQALTSTPAQSLIQHDDEVIEQVAQDIARIMVNQDWVTWVVDEIRALKGKP